jgi:hypothetical protein
MTQNAHLLVPFVASWLTACGAPEDATALIEARSGIRWALREDNALSYNALQTNALGTNALSYNALSYDSLDPASLGALGDPGPAGDLARQFLKYAVSCALDRTQSFRFTWVDSQGQPHDETYPGELGIVPRWTREPLSREDQGWLSSCLISRVNWYERPVMISARAKTDELKKSSRTERRNFSHEEGAFWGNLFTDPPVAYACHDSINIEFARSRYRDCAAGHVNGDRSIAECGIIHIVGGCSEYCVSRNHGNSLRKECGDGTGSKYETAITVFLE